MRQMQGELKEGEMNSAEVRRKYCFREAPKRLTTFVKKFCEMEV